MDQSLVELLDHQYHRETEASRVYTSIAFALEHFHAMDHLVKWARDNATEESKHADAMARYMLDRGVLPTLRELPSAILPKSDHSVRLYIEMARSVEEANTISLNKVYQKALEVQDFRTVAFIQPFLLEQVKSEKKLNDALTWLDTLKKDREHALILHLQKPISKL
eukprot:PhF_6_TR19435/c1_g1_i1/m.28429/K02217/ftnA, ftn; ferritin